MAHACIEFIFKYPFLSYLWHKRSNYVALLSVQDESVLIKLIDKLKSNGIRHVVFREPDINNEITSIAIEPTEQTQKICAGLPLALREFHAENKINKRTHKKLISNHQLIT